MFAPHRLLKKPRYNPENSSLSRLYCVLILREGRPWYILHDCWSEHSSVTWTRFKNSLSPCLPPYRSPLGYNILLQVLLPSLQITVFAPVTPGWEMITPSDAEIELRPWRWPQVHTSTAKQPPHSKTTTIKRRCIPAELKTTVNRINICCIMAVHIHRHSPALGSLISTCNTPPPFRPPTPSTQSSLVLAGQ